MKNPDPLREPKAPHTFTDLAPERLSGRTAQMMVEYRQQILTAVLDEHAESIPADLLMGALREAEALASLTPFPSLFLPALVDEKVRALRAWIERQQRIRSQEVSLVA